MPRSSIVLQGSQLDGLVSLHEAHEGQIVEVEGERVAKGEIVVTFNPGREPFASSYMIDAGGIIHVPDDDEGCWKRAPRG